MSSAAVLNTSVTATNTTPVASPPAILNNRLECVSLTPENIEILKKLNSEIFPVPYPEAYYAVVLRPELARFCKLIYLDGVPMGQITCNLKPCEREGEARVYVMLMGVLLPYRSYGIGSYAVQIILNAAATHNSYLKALESVEPLTPPALAEKHIDNPLRQLSRLPITSLFMHVHVLNTGARHLYERYGFTERKLLKNFYRRKGPDDTATKDAWILERDIGSSSDNLFL